METLIGADQKQQSTRDEILEKYYKEIRRIPVLNAEQEHDLLVRARAGDNIAVEKLVKANLRFVIRIARQYQYNGVPLTDLINEGNIGLIEAIHHFDSGRDTRLITYAVWWIKQHILKAVSGDSGMINIPQNKYWKLIKIKRETDKFEQIHQRCPDPVELADFSGFTLEEIIDYGAVKNVSKQYNDLMDEEGNEIPVNDGSIVSENYITEGLQQESLQTTLESVMKNLSKIEKEVIELSFGLGCPTSYTIDEIAEELGMTKSKARHLRETAIRKLRHRKINRELQEFLCV